MKHALLLILFSLLGEFFASAQDERAIYFEPSGEGMVRFYFDKNYFLVDKACEFKSIERIAGFDTGRSKFNGRFTDFNLKGQVVLEGNYLDGLKDGLFKAYHPNGALKWEMTYKKDVPMDQMNYYYPDGKLMLTLAFGMDYTKIVEFRTRKGKLSVKDGNGFYEMMVPFSGYNPYGYSFIKHKGRLKNGLPNGYWQVLFVEGKSQVLTAEEYYDNGTLEQGYDAFAEAKYLSPVYPKIPLDGFQRAESLVSKQCNFDEFAGFTYYLGEYLSNSLSETRLSHDFDHDFVYSVQVDADGAASKFNLLTELPQQISVDFQRAAKSVQQYIPSFSKGEYLIDTLKIQGKISLNQKGSILIHSIKVIRKQES